MHTPDINDLRKVVDAHLGIKNGEASAQKFEKAKMEIVFTKTALTKAVSVLTMERHLEIAEQSSQQVPPGEQSAADTVDSFFYPLPSESINAAFARAKKEAIAKLKSEVAKLKYFSFKDYCQKKKRVPTKKKRSTNFDDVQVEKR